MSHTDITGSLTGERAAGNACCSLATYTGSREHPSPHAIARLAYQLFETRGRRHGHDVDDWLAAEQELTQQYR
jgi:hypothetical protein